MQSLLHLSDLNTSDSTLPLPCLSSHLTLLIAAIDSIALLTPQSATRSSSPNESFHRVSEEVYVPIARHSTAGPTRQATKRDTTAHWQD
jgi:hypothetical protein